MRRLTHTVMGTLGALVLGATLASAQAPDTNNMTIMTFSAPVSLPGVTLPAGSYMFRLADSQVNRNIVQVFDKDRTKIFATILAVPAERNEPADDTVITFGESPANTAPAIRFWYFPGQRRGQEFAYPTKQATAIANASHTSVLSVDTDDTSASSLQNGKLSRVEPGANANESMAQGAQSATPSTTSQPAAPPAATQEQPSTPSQSAQATQPSATEQPSATPATPPSTPAPSASTAPSTQSTQTPSTATSNPSSTQGAVGTSGRATTGRTSLPKTASTLPLVGFAGLLMLASAVGVRALRRAYA